MSNLIKHNKEEKKTGLSISVSLILLFLFSIALTGVMFLLQNNGVYDLLFLFEKSNGLIFLLNYLPILILIIILFLVSNNIIITMGVSGVLITALSFVNRYKIQMRQHPLQPMDFSLFTEVLEIFKNFTSGSYFLIAIGGIIIFIIIAVVLFKLIKTRKINPYIRVIATAITMIVFMILNKKVYSDVKLFNEQHVMGNVYNQVEVFESKGFVYSFIYTYNQNTLKKFPGYKKEIVEQLISEYPEGDFEKYKEEKRPNIILILSEGFSEIGEHPTINYDGYTDPLENYKKIKEESILYGELITPSIGGGTADTEFDILTGINTRYFRGVPYAYRMISKNIYGITEILNKLNYDNVSIHPGHRWFYDRQNVFEYFGFSKFIDITEFPEDMYKGMYVDETSTFNRVIKEFEEATSKENHNPFFEFVITIQNHGPYVDKYLSETNFNQTGNLNEEDINALSNYFEGLADGDRELKRFVDYLSASDEPTILIYYGDHVPGFSNSIYEELVYSKETEFEELTNIYKTPFIIWENKASKEEFNIKDNLDKLNLPENNNFSSPYLASIIIEMLGFENIDPFTTYSLDMLNDYPVILEEAYFDRDFKLHPYDENDEKIKNYKYWQYYKIFDEE